MTQYLSDKIKILSFVAILLVLYIHSVFHDYPHEILGMEFNHFLQSAISEKIGRCAVPLFYMISGYLFFRKVNSLDDVFGKMRKRVKSLLIPYSIAAIFFPICLLLIEQIPFAAKMSNGSGFLVEFQKPIGDVLRELFIAKDGGTSPWAFHLWFLRDLIIIVACSPVLFYLRKYLKSGWVCLIFFLLSYIHMPVVSFSSFFWFIAGDAFLNSIEKIRSWFWPMIYIVISVIEMVSSNDCFTYLQIPITFVGVIAIWSVYDFLVDKSFCLNHHHYMSIACSFTFFIYLFHEPTLNIVRKLLILILGRTSFGFAVNYLVSPWIFAFGFIILGYFFRKYAPRLYSICVGGR